MPEQKTIGATPQRGDVIAGDLLVIGYGNTLRQDDGAGPRVAERVTALHLPGTRTLVCQQLSPEHAEEIAGARAVIFVDASIEPSPAQLRSLLPADSTRVTTHTVEPPILLALARDLFGRSPRAWWLTIPVVQLGFGEDLSPAAQRGIDAAVRKVTKLLRGASRREGAGDPRRPHRVSAREAGRLRGLHRLCRAESRSTKPAARSDSSS